MSEGSHSLQVADTRSPFAKALHILRDGRECPEEIVGDLSSLVVELSRKHFGITSEVMVEGALDGAVSLVSAGLLLAAGRSHSDARLAEILRSEGIRGACSVFTQYVKEITEGHPYYKTPREVLRCFFTASSSTRGWTAGFKELQRLHAEAKHETDMGLVKEWMVRNTLQGRRLIQNPHPFIDREMTHEVIRLVILQYCGIQENIETDFDIEDRDINDSSIDELMGEPQDVHITLAPAPYKSAGLRYQELLAKMPLKLRLTLDPMKGQSWFDENVFLQNKEPKKAPKKVNPKVKAKAKAKGNVKGKV